MIMRRKMFNLFQLCICMLLLMASCDDEQDMKSVDLRYNPESKYVFSAKGTETYQFQVKSTDLWKVYGKSDWCMISPEEGAPGEIFDVTLSCKENESLDDRTDTLTVQSDYWVGTQFVVLQKGTAYLMLTPETGGDVEEDEEGQYVYFNKDEAQTAVMKVAANQKWSVSIPEDAEWLEVAGNTSGENDGSFTLSVSPNGGEQRECVVTLLDRNGKISDPPATFRIVQEGIVLQTDETYSRVDTKGGEISFTVKSNSKWTARKGNESDDWYTIVSPSGEQDGDGQLILDVSSNNNTSFKTADIIIETVAESGAVSISKTISIKQGYEPIADEYPFDEEEGKKWVTRSGSVTFGSEGATMSGGMQCSQPNMPLGTYSFYLKSMSSDANPFINLCTSQPAWNEVSFILRGPSRKADARTMPWAPGTEDQYDKTDVDITQPHVLTVKLYDKEGQVKIEWWFDGEYMTEHWGRYESTTPGVNPFDWPTAVVENRVEVFFGLFDTAGSCTFEKYTYQKPLDWNDGL